MLLRYHGLIPSICETRSDRDTQIEDDPHDALKSRVLSSVAQSLTRASSTLRQRSVADLTDEVRLLAKRHPGAFMAAAAVVGFAAARFGRSSARRRGLGQPQGPYQGPQS